MSNEGGVIDIGFDDGKLARDCSDNARGQRRFGARWPTLKRRLAILRSAPTLQDLRNAPGHCHELTGDRRGSLAVRLSANERLLFRIDHDPPPRDDQGGLSWQHVTKIVIEEVVDYHG